MNRLHLILFLFLLTTLNVAGQSNMYNRNGGGSTSGRAGGNARMGANASDSLGSSHKQIPKGIKVWTVDERFGERRMAKVDTLQHLYPNTIFTSGLYGEYNTLGNLGAPRINRIFANREVTTRQFIFTEPYDYFLIQPSQQLFTNTLSPLTTLNYNFCGNRMNGEDRFTAKYAVNAGKHLGAGFLIDYLYGRGYYESQSNSLLNLTLYGSYLGERYQAHLRINSNSQKVTENGGITNDMYITKPESFDDNYTTSEIPTVLSRNWNRNKNQHIFLTHRYSLGFNRKVKMTDEEIEARKFAIESQKAQEAARKARENGEDEDDGRRKKKRTEETFNGRPDNATIAKEPLPADSLFTDSVASARLQMDKHTADSILALEKQNAPDTSWLKNEFVPVTSFIHTANLNIYDRIYQAYRSPAGYYTNDYFTPDIIGGDSIYDNTKYLQLKNTFAISLLEGFNKWAMAGIKGFVSSDLRRFSLPDEHGVLRGDTDHNLSIGGQLAKTQGNALHYSVTAETWLQGSDLGQIHVDADLDLRFKLLGDTVTLAASGFFHNNNPGYYYKHYHSRHSWWDEDLSMNTHTRLQGLLRYDKTHTSLRATFDELTNYTYFGMTYDTANGNQRLNHNISVRQCGDPISVFTAEVCQDFRFGKLNWENRITYQKSTNEDVLPVPAFNIYTNLYLKFNIAKVLHTELGADARYFTEYAAPDYAPSLGQFVVQENAEKVKLGNYPIVNVYANFNLKGTRFFVMYSHANNGMGNRNSFLVPHYPLNGSVLRIGLCWNFYN